MLLPLLPAAALAWLEPDAIEESLMARPSERVEPVLHNRLAVLRAERNLSRQELADAIGVNYQTIGYLERGEYNPSLDLALRAAEFFALPVEAIFSRRPFAPMSSQLYPAPLPSVAEVPNSQIRHGRRAMIGIIEEHNLLSGYRFVIVEYVVVGLLLGPLGGVVRHEYAGSSTPRRGWA